MRRHSSPLDILEKKYLKFKFKALPACDRLPKSPNDCVCVWLAGKARLVRNEVPMIYLASRIRSVLRFVPEISFFWNSENSVLSSRDWILRIRLFSRRPDSIRRERLKIIQHHLLPIPHRSSSPSRVSSFWSFFWSIFWNPEVTSRAPSRASRSTAVPRPPVQNHPSRIRPNHSSRIRSQSPAPNHPFLWCIQLDLGTR